MITYVTGDATDPQTPGTKVIAHVCNNTGGWGHGFVLSVSKRWSGPEQSYRQWFAERDSEDTDFPPMELGSVVFVPVAEGTYVANMVAQLGTKPKDGLPPIRYNALEECLRDVEQWARDNDHATVHMPRIGCGLAGGKWNEVEEIINRIFIDINVFVYDFNTGDARTIPWNK